MISPNIIKTAWTKTIKSRKFRAVLMNKMNSNDDTNAFQRHFWWVSHIHRVYECNRKNHPADSRTKNNYKIHRLETSGNKKWLHLIRIRFLITKFLPWSFRIVTVPGTEPLGDFSLRFCAAATVTKRRKTWALCVWLQWNLTNLRSTSRTGCKGWSLNSRWWEPQV